MLSLGIAVQPIRLSRSTIALLKCHDTIRGVICASKQSNFEGMIVTCCTGLSKIPLLMKIMELTPIPDLEVEDVLNKLRKGLLLGRETLSEKGRLLQFQNALALQCFTNEYIYGETEEETLAIKELEAKIDKAFYSGEELCSYDIACLASYRPLYSYSWASDMAPRDGLDSLLLRQVIEIQQERNLKKDITILNPIEDDVSKSVRAQYEENPYPRWINTKLELEKCSIQKW